MSAGIDDSGCNVMHVDMDAFFASVTIRDRPDLRDKPVLVGGPGRGVVLSATYPARRCGVRSGMPMSRALGLCPKAVMVVPKFDEISVVSKAVMETFRSVTPAVRALSIDEAFLDVSALIRQHRRPSEVAEEIRARIADEQRITCSIGVATTKQLAKLASRKAKPDGLLVVPAADSIAFLHPLDVGELWGVGAKTAARLRGLGLLTVGDLATAPQNTLRRALGRGYGSRLHAMAWGRDGGAIVEPRRLEEPEHSVGAEETFAHDTADPNVIRRELLRLSVKVAARMRAASVCGRTVTIKVRSADFTTLTRALTLRSATNLTPEIYAAALRLHAALDPVPPRVRLVGVRVQHLVDVARCARQLELGQPDNWWPEVERAVDDAVARFGRGAVKPAVLLG